VLIEGLDTEGEKNPPMGGIISQVKRQEEGDTNKIVFLLLFWAKIPPHPCLPAGRLPLSPAGEGGVRGRKNRGRDEKP